MKRKTNQKILIGIGIIIFVFVIAYWQILYCSNEFYTLANYELTKDKYRRCNLNSDCKILSCGICLNLEGASKYNNLKQFCLGEPKRKCLIPIACFCINNTCTAQYGYENFSDAKPNLDDNTTKKVSENAKESLRQIALNHIAKTNNISEEHLEIVNEEEVIFPLIKQKLWIGKVIDKKSGKTYSIYLDEKGNIADYKKLREKEDKAHKDKYGKLEPALYEKLQSMSSDDKIKVLIGLTPTAKRQQFIDEMNEKGLYVYPISPSEPLLFANLTKEEIFALEKRDDVVAIYLSRIYEPETQESIKCNKTDDCVKDCQILNVNV